MLKTDHDEILEVANNFGQDSHALWGYVGICLNNKLGEGGIYARNCTQAVAIVCGELMAVGGAEGGEVENYTDWDREMVEESRMSCS